MSPTSRNKCCCKRQERRHIHVGEDSVKTEAGDGGMESQTKKCLNSLTLGEASKSSLLDVGGTIAPPTL